MDLLMKSKGNNQDSLAQMAARSIPDRKVGRSSRSGVNSEKRVEAQIRAFFFNFYY